MRDYSTKIIIIILILSFWLIPTPALAVMPEKTLLTPELLQKRLNSPIQSEGIDTIDLSQLVIDLTTKNSPFREQFYQQVSAKLNGSGTPFALDLSNSLIQGEFNANQLGLPTPLSQGALSSLLTPQEQEQIAQDERFLTEPGEQIPYVTVFRGVLKLRNTRLSGTVDFANSFFLQRIDATDSVFVQPCNWSKSRFNRSANFSRATFGGDSNFSGSKFFQPAEFKQAKFRGETSFSGATFLATANWGETEFLQLANFTRTQWLQEVDWHQVQWRDRILLGKSRFHQSLLLNQATFTKSASFRDSDFLQPVILRDANLFDQVDFSNTSFAPGAYLNVEALTFESPIAKLLGDVGEIGWRVYLPRLQGNEDVFRNLVRNFRQQEQIADANRVEYTRELLRLQELGMRIEASAAKFIPTFSLFFASLHWLGLSLLLLLSNYGTNFSLVAGVGMVTITYFGLLFWLLDRARKRLPEPILPQISETIYMLSSFGAVNLIAMVAIFRSSEQPWLTLLCLGFVLLPLPLGLMTRLYQKGRYHDLLDVTYFVEDGSLRQLRLLIGRLPIMPRFYFFRDRYLPILWNRRWNWLNYYDFSGNNLLKFGFNDIRLRDEHLPGIIATLAWYQWGLGILYIALLLWTLSRTIPGLNLLIYLQ